MSWIPGAVLLAAIGVGIARTWWKGMPGATKGKAGDSSGSSSAGGLM
jgi:hypothetical protein